MPNKKKDINAPVKPKPECTRFHKENFQIIKNNQFNVNNIPWGFNWVLGYCEKSAQFLN